MAQAQLLFRSGTGPELPSPVGTRIGPTLIDNQTVPSVSWNCGVAVCDVEGMTMWAFVDAPFPARPTPTSVQVQLSQRAFDFSDIPPSFGFTVPGNAIFTLGPCLTGEAPADVQFCQFSLNFHHSYDMPHGTDWISLSAMQGNAPLDTFWSNANITPSGSNTLVLNVGTGAISGYPSSLVFSVFGTPVPEPSSILMLGTGILGLAGVVRRKLMR
jgi:hypothetical protein